MLATGLDLVVFLGVAFPRKEKITPAFGFIVRGEIYYDVEGLDDWQLQRRLNTFGS